MKNNKFINAEIPVSNRREAELAAKRAEELGYSIGDVLLNYKDDSRYLTLTNNGCYGFWRFKDEGVHVIPLSEFLDQKRTETVTLENGGKWRAQLIEKVQEEPMNAREYYEFHTSVGNVCDWMESYAKYRLEFERDKANKHV